MGQQKVQASVSNRVIAKVIDLVLVFLVAAILPYFIGPLLGFFYSLFCDGFQFGPFVSQSVGKRVMGLQVVSTKNGEPITYKESLIRNTPVGLATFFAIIPFWGWIILGLVGIPLMAIELYLMITVESSHRLGDVMADSQVVLFTEQTQKDKQKDEHTTKSVKPV